MYQFILLIQIFVGLFIVALVLVQQGKGAAMGAAFGSGASQTIFGSRGSGSFLYRLTMILIAIFFMTSITLNYMATEASKEAKVITMPQPTPKQPNAALPSEIPVKK
jgi:preprotein translocase subunit SecG